MELPLFPLNTVLFPGGVLPLRIFETRYIDMVRRCLREDSGFGVCLIREGAETGAPAAVHAVATEAHIIDWEQRSDGLLGIVAEGRRKLRILRTRAMPDRLLMGEVEALPEEPHILLPTEFQSLAALLQRILGEIGPPYSKLPARLDDAAWVGSRLIELLPLEHAEKQRLLELDEPLARLFHLRDAMLRLDLR